MRNKQGGFTVIEAAVIILIIAVIGAVGFKVYNNRHQTVAGNASVAATAAAAPGTTQAVTNLLTQQMNDESQMNSAQASSDQSTVQSANNAASDIGGAYNENNF